MKVLFLLSSNKKIKVEMKIKAKNTNSASENAIRSSYFVIQSRKLMHLARSPLSMKRMTLLHGYMCLFMLDGSTHAQKIKILTNHISDQPPYLLAILTNHTVKYAYLMISTLKINRM